MPTKPALIIHAGTGRYPKNLERAKSFQKKLSEISEIAFKFLKTHSAVDAVVKAVQLLEDWPETNAGIGSVLQSDGKARLSASLMGGHQMIFSGVINLEQIKNPILVAKLLQKENDRILAGEGAFQFAKSKGFKIMDTRTQKSIRFWKSQKKAGKYGTVGACALDRFGHLAAATSTGGKGMELIGRVSDSALPAGNFANSFAAISATGIGEDIVNESLASVIASRALDGKNLNTAVEKTFREAKKRKRRFAVIGLDKNGNPIHAKTTEILYYAFCSSHKNDIFSL